MRQLHELPFDTTVEDELGYQLFREAFWQNSEICNACFTRVRDVGPKVEKRLGDSDQHALLRHGPTMKLEINQWFERTDYGSQEHHTWDKNKRFGTCFCLECGSDCTANHRNKSIDELKPLAANIFKFAKKHTPHDMDHKRFGREIRKLKKKPEAQGYETEILALSFARALNPDLPNATASGQSQSQQTAPAGD